MAAGVGKRLAGNGGIAALEGFENDGITAVPFTKYDGTGAGAYGAAKCSCGSGSTLLVIGSGSNTYGVSCPGPGNCSGPTYSLVITHSGSLPVNFKLEY